MVNEMESKGILILFVIIAFALVRNIQCSFDQIKYFLTNYEITNVTNLDRRNTLRSPLVEKNTKRFQISAFGNTFIIDVSIYFQREDIEVDYISKLINESNSFLGLNYVLHFGFVHDVKKSFVLGFSTKQTPFRGYIVTDEVYCVEPLEEPNMVIVYRFKDVITPGCSKNFDNNDLECSESLYFKPWKANKPPKRASSYYMLFYDKYFEKYKQQLLAKKASETRRKEYQDEKTGRKGNATCIPNYWKHHSGKDKVDKGYNKEKRHHNQSNHHKDDKVGIQSATSSGGKDSNRFKGINVNIDDVINESQDSNSINQMKLSEINKVQHLDAKGKDGAKSKGDQQKTKEKESNKEKADTKELEDLNFINQMKLPRKNKTHHTDAKGKHGAKNVHDHDDDDDEDDEVKSKGDKQKTKEKERNKEKADTNELEDLNFINQLKLPRKNKTRHSDGKGKHGAKNVHDHDDDDDDEEEDDEVKNMGDKQKTKEKERNKEKADTNELDDLNFINQLKLPRKNKTRHSEAKEKHGVKNVDNHDDDDDDDDDSHLNYEKDDDLFKIEENYLTEAKDIRETSNNKKAKHYPSIAEDILKDLDNINSLKMWKDDSYKGSGELDYETDMNDIKSIKAPITEALSSSVEAIQCNLQLIVSPSLRQKFGNNDEMVTKDIVIQISLLNKIFEKVPITRKGVASKLFFNVRQIILHVDQAHSPFQTDADLEYFTRLYPEENEICLTIGLVNQPLKSGQLFDGYIPEGGGGACAVSGKTVMVSHGNENTPAPMALYFAALIRGITRALGANDKDKECQVGSYPNPMQVLQNYLLNDAIESKKEYSIFSTCNVQKIQEHVEKKACFAEVPEPLCGNAIYDEGEECDCGPTSICSQVDSCCNAPNFRRYGGSGKTKNKKSKGQLMGCKLLEDAKCSQLQDCCVACEINTVKSPCSSGHGVCDIGMCDGKNANCPTGVEASNGMICSINDTHKPEPLLCTDNKCEKLLCTSFDLRPCTCASGTGRDCVYCCLKDGKCQAAGTELKLIENRNFFLKNGVECMGGTCLDGKCITLSGRELHLYNFSFPKPPRFPVWKSSSQKHSALTTILGTALSFLVLFLYG